MVDLFKSRLYIFIFSAVLGQKSDNLLHIDNIPIAFVFKKTPVSKWQASLRRFGGYKNDRKVHLQKFHLVLMLLMKAPDTNNSIKSRKVNFSGIYIYFIILSV